VPLVSGVREGGRGRVKVFVDGEFWAELDSKVAVERALFEGAELSDEELARVRVAGEKPLAMNRALYLLGYRARSEGELCERLLRVGYAAQTVDEVLRRLEELGYLDDEEFARELARSGVRNRYGPRRIFGDLKRAGVGEEVARGVVEDGFAGRSEYAQALEIARQRYNTKEGSDAQARRVYGFLMRRGYSAGVCAEIARLYRRGTDE
jgi:regulatory protein